MNEDKNIYHFDVKYWLNNHLSEVPENYKLWIRKFAMYCRSSGVSEISIYAYLGS